jgi:hypothetical protein
MHIFFNDPILELMGSSKHDYTKNNSRKKV